MGLVKTGKAAVLPALPAKVFERMKRVKTWPSQPEQAGTDLCAAGKSTADPKPESPMRRSQSTQCTSTTGQAAQAAVDLKPEEDIKKPEPDLKKESLESNAPTSEPEGQGSAEQAVPFALLRLREAQKRRRNLASQAV
jgi:hypothetical protein